MQKHVTFFSEEIYSEHLTTINGIKFTCREIDVIACLLNARRTSQIASILSISPRTVTTHFRNVMLRLDCNSQEGIINFLEKSDKLSILREYYTNLIAQAAFERSLKEISRLSHREVPGILVVYWKNQTLKDYLLSYLTNHLGKAGIKAEVFEYTSNQKIEEIPRSSPHTLLLTLKMREIGEIPNLTSLNSIDLSEYHNYYFAAFKIIEQFLTQDKLSNILAHFETHSKRLISSFGNNKSQILLEDVSMGKPASENFFRILSLFKHKKWHIASSLVVMCFSCIGLLVFKEYKEPIQNASQTFSSSQEKKDNLPIRSDLVIPAESFLLYRPELISEIDNKFKDQKGIQTVALVGPGGAGKTTLARQYGRQQNAHVVWEVNAETLENLKSSFENLAQVLATTEQDKTLLKGLQATDDSIEKDKKIIYFVKDHLRYYKNWLLIFDNVEKFADIQKYLPQDSLTWGQGKVIITTRDSNIQINAHVGNIIFIRELNSNQKLELFTRITNSRDTQPISPTQINKIKLFLEHIPPFPLDVSVSAYYLMLTGIPYEAYLESIAVSNRDFEEVQKILLKETGTYTKTRYGIINSSLQALLNANEGFRDLLLLISLIDSQDILRELLEKYKGKTIVDNFIYNLKKHSLITKESSSVRGGHPIFSIHRSTQAIILAYFIKSLNLEKNKNLIQQLGLTLEEYIAETVDKGDFSKLRSLINHIKFFLSHDSLLDQSIKYAIKAELGDAYAQLFQFMDAKPLLEESFSFVERSNENYCRIARILTALGRVYRELGQYEKARLSLEKSLSIYKKHLPNNYSGIAQSLLILGHIYRGTGKYEKAKDLYENSLEIYKKYLSEDTDGAAWVLGSLGIIYKEFGEYEKARNYLVEALAGFPETDIGFGRTLAHMANIFTSLGYYEKAIEYLERSLTIYKNNYSEQAIGFGWVLAHLGEAYKNLKDYKKAKNLLEQALVIYKKNNLAENNSGFPWALAQLGSIEVALGNSPVAHSLLTQSFQIYEKLFGKDHIETARVLRNVGQNYLLEGNIEKAGDCFHKAFLIFKAHRHPDTYIILEDLAELSLKKLDLQKDKGNIHSPQHFNSQAISYLKEALQITKTHFPKDSPHITRIEAKLRKLKEEAK